MATSRSERTKLLGCVAVALAVTMLDGFDAMSLSLAAPLIAREFGVPPGALGLLFSCQMAGMMLGAACGGYVADRFGRLASLLSFMSLFALAAFTMPLMHGFPFIAANRFAAGLGLGAAAPIAVALVAASSPLGRSAFVISTIWGGLPAGGIFAALYNYAFTPRFGWESIFVLGGVLPAIVALPAYMVFRNSAPPTLPVARPGFGGAVRETGKGRLAALGLLFLCGYSAMSIIVYWLPTIMTMREAGALVIMIAFIGVNLGSAVGSSLIGYGSDRIGMRVAAPMAWFLAGICLLALELPDLGTSSYVLLAAVAATFVAGAIALLVTLASRLLPDYASTTIGLMVTIGRLGQVGALALTGAVAGSTVQGAGVFALAGIAALTTALLALVALRHPRLVALPA